MKRHNYYLHSLIVGARSIALQATLQSWAPSNGSVLLQYVNDLLLCSPSQEACQKASVLLLEHLAQTGHKVSKKKLQWCQVLLCPMVKGE